MKLFRNTDKFFGVADSGMISLARLGAGIAFAKLAGSSAFAEYLLLSMGGMIFLNLVITLHITPMVNLATGKASDCISGLFKWTGQRLRKVYLPGILLATLGVPVILHFELDTMTYLGFVAATLTAIELHFQRARLQALFKMKTAVSGDALAIGLIAMTVLGAWHGGIGIEAAFWWGSAMGNVLGAFIMRKGAFPHRNEMAQANAPEADLQTKAKSTGTAMLTGSIANSVCSRLQPFILGGMGGAMVVATFGASWSLIGPWRMLSGALNGMLRPRLALHKERGNRKAFDRSLTFVYFIFAAAGLSGIVFSYLLGPSIVSFFYGEGLRQSGRLLPIAVAYGTLDALTTSQMVAMQVRLKMGANLASRLRVIASLVSIVFLLPACFYAGAWGAYGALLLAEMTYALMAAAHLSDKITQPEPEQNQHIEGTVQARKTIS